MKFEKNIPKNILIVDDDKEARDFFKEQLLNRGYETTTASGGAQAIELVRNDRYGLVICDLRMHLMDGLAVIENIKSLDPNLPIIMVSGEGDVASAVDALKKGAVDFLEKPVKMEQLFALIERVFNRSQIESLIMLYETSRSIFSQVRFEEILEPVMDLLKSLFHADQISLAMKKTNDRLDMISMRGFLNESAKDHALKVNHRVCQLTASSSRPFFIVNASNPHSEFKDLNSDSEVYSAILVPFYGHEGFLGVLNLSRTSCREKYTIEDAKNASIFGEEITRSIEYSKLYHRFEDKLQELKKVYEALENTKHLLVEKEKLAGLGTSVASMVHEINNPLTTVIGYADFLLRSSELQIEMKENLQVIFNEAHRCQEMVSDLLAYSRPHKPKLEPVDIVLLLKEILRLQAFEIQKGLVQADFYCAKDAFFIQGDPLLLRQVFVNLIRNAYQALQNKEGPRKIRIDVEDRKDAVIIVRDNGPGIAPDILAKIFTPFFTTKNVGIGTGLGLSICRNIVQEHGGSISACNDSPASGAVFTIKLPILPLVPPRYL